nr:hypothetical protein [Tanacetum cinerariifolium]
MDRCKGCKNYLTVTPSQPCSVCYKVSKPKKKNNHQVLPQLPQYTNGYVNQPSSNNYYNGSYGQQPTQTPPAYGGYYAPPPVYGVGYYSPQPRPQPSVYSNGYNRPPPQAVSPPIVYGNGYNNNSNQQPTNVHEKKKAVLCGVTYKGHKQTLPASVNNVRSMHQLLVKLGFPNASIRILTGHGSHVADHDGDEKDGYDEAICPVDYNTAGKILDDEVNPILVAPLPHAVVLHSIMDSCYSGTLLDLPFLCRINPGGFYKWEDHHPSHVSSYGGTSGGKAICISACDDHQNSADTSVFTGNAIGALTYSFVQAVQSERKLTYGDLLDNMSKVVREAQQQQGLNAPFASSTSQEPQISCSTRFEIYSEPLIL